MTRMKKKKKTFVFPTIRHGITNPLGPDGQDVQPTQKDDSPNNYQRSSSKIQPVVDAFNAGKSPPESFAPQKNESFRSPKNSEPLRPPLLDEGSARKMIQQMFQVFSQCMSLPAPSSSQDGASEDMAVFLKSTVVPFPEVDILVQGTVGRVFECIRFQKEIRSHFQATTSNGFEVASVLKSRIGPLFMLWIKSPAQQQY